jgi:hypothetical protein
VGDAQDLLPITTDLTRVWFPGRLAAGALPVVFRVTPERSGAPAMDARRSSSHTCDPARTTERHRIHDSDERSSGEECHVPEVPLGGS